ncbi:MAG: hypothetical protein IKF01_03920 [Bacilli bacterium]|nr:hypothetical protein [Bacilli bacterium]
MNILLYFGIFLFKIIEDSLSTLRLIVVSNGKKVFGAILQFIVTIIWVILTGSVLINFMKDIYKIIAFSLGALVGSYFGSLLEEKIALGTSGFTIKIKKNKVNYLKRLLCDKHINIIDFNNGILLVTLPRKMNKKVLERVRKVDDNAIIICEKVKNFSL